MAITIKEIQVKTTIERNVSKTEAVPEEIVHKLKSDILKEIYSQTDLRKKRKER